MPKPQGFPWGFFMRLQPTYIAPANSAATSTHKMPSMSQVKRSIRGKSGVYASPRTRSVKN